MLFETQTAFVPSLLSFPDSLIHIKPQELNCLPSLMCQHVGYHFTHTHTRSHTCVSFWWWGPGRYLISWKEAVKLKQFLKQTRCSDFYWPLWWSQQRYQENGSTHSELLQEELPLLKWLSSVATTSVIYFCLTIIFKVCFCRGRIDKNQQCLSSTCLQNNIKYSQNNFDNCFKGEIQKNQTGLRVFMIVVWIFVAFGLLVRKKTKQSAD